MKTPFLTLLFLLLLLSAGACTQNQGEYAPAMEEEMFDAKSATEGDLLASRDESSFDQASGQQQPLVTDRQIIKTATMRMAVENYQEAQERIRQQLVRWAASLESEEEHRDPYRLENAMVIRVPPEKLDSLLTSLEEIALQVEFKRVEATDVTRQYVDLTTRLETKRDAVTRYRQILQSARTVEEVLDVEDHLRQVIEEIESVEQQLRLLKDQVAMSTLRLTIYEEFARPEVHRKSFWSRLGSAFGDGWEVFLNLLLGMASIWPVALIVVALAAWFFRSRRRKKGS